MMMKLNKLDWVALALVLVGGLNWGFVAIGWNLVGALLAPMPMLLTLVYGLVGVSAVYVIFATLKKLM